MRPIASMPGEWWHLVGAAPSGATAELAGHVIGAFAMDRDVETVGLCFKINAQ